MDLNGQFSSSGIPITKSVFFVLLANLGWRRCVWFAIAVVIGGIVAQLPLVAVTIIIGFVVALLLAISTPVVSLVFLLVLAPLRTLIATELNLNLPLDIGQILVVLFFAVYLADVVVWKRSLFVWRWTPVYVPVAMFVVLSSIAMLNADLLGHWVSEYLKWVLIALIVYVVLSLEAFQANWHWLILALVVAGVANSLVGFYIFFGGSGSDHLLIMGRFFRAFGTFGQPNPFGGFMGLLIPIALMSTYGYALSWLIEYRESSGPYWRLLVYVTVFGVATLLLVMGLVVSWSRGAWLGFVVSVGSVAFALPYRLWQSILLLLVVVGLVVGLWSGGLLPDAVVARVVSSTEDFFAFDDVRGVDITAANYAVVERLAHWQAAINMAEQNPWLGVGLGNYEVVYEEYRLLNWREPLGHAHNYYLNILAEAGIIGFILYVIAWAGIVWLTWRTRSHPDPLSRSVVIGLLGSWVYLAVHSFLDNLYVNNVFIHIGVCFAVLSILHNQVCNVTRIR